MSNEKILDHKNCSFSTGIDGSITAGQGQLDYNGYFEFPCHECAKRANENWRKDYEKRKQKEIV